MIRNDPKIEGKVFGVYKPKGPTSFDVVARVRKLTGIKKVGHAGTLDPLAEGVLVIAVGSATKKIAEVVAKEKEYEAIVRLGMTSTTDDEEGEKEELPSTNYQVPNREEVETVLQKFIGNISQVPPAYSAVKVKGKAAYKYARQGKEVELKPREVFVKNITLIHYEWPQLKLLITTGPGVYIRSLARDIGRELGVGGYMTALKRTRVGEFRAKEAVLYDELPSFLKSRNDNQI